MIPFSKKEKEVIHQIHLLTGLPHKKVRKVFEGFLKYAYKQFLEKEEMLIPLVGSLTLRYLGDRENKRGREAQIDADFDADKYFKRIVGQTVDGEENDLEKHMKEEMVKIIKEALEE